MFNQFNNFDTVFGSKSRSREPQENIVKVLDVTLEQIYNEETIDFTYMQNVFCSLCNGEGTKNGKPNICSVCNGKGVHVQLLRLGPMIQQSIANCQTCNATGKIKDDNNICNTCKGNCFIKKSKTIQIPLKAGLTHNNKINLTGKGNQYKNLKTDLILTINELIHPYFKRYENDLFIELDIKLYQALFGFNTVITHLDNRKLSLTYREKTDVNTIRKIKNEGMKYLQSDLRGDLYIKFNVSIPSIKLLDDNSKTQLKILLQLVEPNLEKQELKSSGEKTNSFSPQNSKVSDPSINKVISDLPSQNLADKIHKVILCDCTQDEVNKLNKSQNQTKSVNEQDNDKNHYAFESNFASGQMGNTTECRQS